MHPEPERPRVGPAGFTRSLLLGSQRAPVSLPLERRKSSGAPRMRWIADALKKDALGWACRQGGWRERQVVVAGRRQEGRLWDPKIFPRLGVTFTPGPLLLLTAAMEDPDPLPLLGPGLLARIGVGLEGEQPATGDLLALHRIVSALLEGARTGGWPGEGRRREPTRARCPSCDEPLAPEAGAAPRPSRPRTRGGRRARQPRCPRCDRVLNVADLSAPSPSDAAAAHTERGLSLLELSPLTCVFQPQRAGGLAGEDFATRLAPLFKGDRGVLMTYLDDALAGAWLDQEEERRKLPGPEALVSYEHTTRTLEGFVRAAPDRPDALRPLIRFFELYVVRRFGGRAPVGEALRQQSQGFNRASEREAFLRAASRLFGLGGRVGAAVERALSAPYVDRTEAERVLLADYHERFREVRPEVEAIRRELAGEIG